MTPNRGFGWWLRSPASVERAIVWNDTLTPTYLVDPASSDTLVSKIKPCKCKYRPSKRSKPRTAHYNGRNLLDRTNQLDNCGNSRANTCTRALILACRLRSAGLAWPHGPVEVRALLLEQDRPGGGLRVRASERFGVLNLVGDSG